MRASCCAEMPSAATAEWVPLAGSADCIDRDGHEAKVHAGGIAWRELTHQAVDAHGVRRREVEHAEQRRDRHEDGIDFELSAARGHGRRGGLDEAVDRAAVAALDGPGGEERVLARRQGRATISERWLLWIALAPGL